jgi:hypothetical protein
MTTRGEKVCKFIERYCLIPEGSKVGQPIKLLDFQRKFVLDVYDNPAGTSRAYLSVARKIVSRSSVLRRHDHSLARIHG